MQNAIQLSCSSIGSWEHLRAEVFKQITGTEIVHVPYDVTDLLQWSLFLFTGWHAHQPQSVTEIYLALVILR